MILRDRFITVSLVAALGLLLTSIAQAQEASLSPQEMAQRTLHRRAVEAAIWGMPLVSVEAMRQAFFRDAGAKNNDIVYYSTKADWKFQVTTPQASTFYVFFMISMKDGPLVLEIPPAEGAGLFGVLNDAWHVPLAEVGPRGEDGGKGGKYLLIPPGYKDAVPPGYIPVRFNTYNGYCLLRAIPETTSEDDIGKAMAMVKSLRLYPLSQAADPPAQKHVDMTGRLFDGIAHFDDTFYDSLAAMVNEEPMQPRDMVAMQMLKTIGIEKGKPFRPDAGTRLILKDAVREAHAEFIRTVMDQPPFAEGSDWHLPGSLVGPETGFSYELDGRLDYDARGSLFYLVFSPPKNLGAATFYLMGTRDANDATLRGEKTYRLRVPPNVPARQFWAVTVYDLETAGFIRESPRVEMNSFEQIEKNPDGSVDVYFGPEAPVGKELNWVYTSPGGRWFAFFRWYGPEKAVFDKTWVLPDIEEVKR